MQFDKIRILQVGKFYPILGGVEKVMYDLMCGLSHLNISCDMLCAAVDGKGFIKQINEHARLFCTHSLCKKAATMISPAMIATLRKRCNEYDIIHVHHPDPMAALALFLSGYKGKVVLHWHSDIVKQRWLLKAYLPLQNWLIRRADCIVGTSPVYLEGSPFLKKVQDKTVCLPIGIEEMPRNPSRVEEIRRDMKGKKLIFSLGRMVPYKGFSYLVEAAQYLGNEYVIVIGGNGPLKKNLQQRIKELSLQNKIFLPGRISDDDLLAYYEACQLFCLPSVMKTEAFGIVQIEAMSFGKPVVTTRIPDSGVSWVNAHGVSGLNVPPCDARALAKAIMDICDNAEDYKRYSEGALKNFQERFTQRKMIESCLDIYAMLWK